MNGISHVLMTADAVGGVWTYAMDVARGLAPRGVRVSLATMGAPLSPTQAREAAGIRGLDVFESTWKLEWMNDPWEEVDAAGDWLLDIERQVKPDIVHLNGFAHGALAWNVPAVVVAHSDVVSWWHAVHQEDPPQSWGTYRRRVHAGLVNAAAVVSITKSVADAVARHYGVRSDAVIYNGHRAEHFRAAAKDPLVVTCGRIWDEAKNVATVDRAAPLIRGRVLVAGDQRHPDGRSAPLQHCEAMGKLDAAHLHGLLARAAVYALPARYEPFGLSVLEAAASRCALILGDTDSLRELWNGAAFFVPPSDHEALAAAANALLARPALRDEFGRRAQQRAARYGLEPMIDRYLETYSQARSGYKAAREAGA